MDNSKVTILDEDMIYIIPGPQQLIDSINIPNGVNVKITNKTSMNIQNEQSQMFFIENPNIFKKYMEKIQNSIPENFNMYIKTIIAYIKEEGMEEGLDDYWLSMLNNVYGGKKRRKSTKKRRPKKSRKSRRIRRRTYRSRK
jgi:hypothetical protein